MTSKADELSQIMETLEAMRAELSGLGDRVAALESVATARHSKGDAGEPLSDELVVVIGAAIAAFLGKRAHIRQIRILGSASWAQQGRASIQASHALTVKHH